MPAVLGLLTWALCAKILPPAVADEPPAATDEHQAVKDFFSHFNALLATDNPGGISLCHIGGVEFMFEVSRGLLSGRTEYKPYIFFLRLPKELRQSFEELRADFPNHVSQVEDRRSFDSYCTLTMLPVGEPRWNAEDVRSLTWRSEVALLGHFQYPCGAKDYGCRFFYGLWHPITGDVEPRCGEFFCTVAVSTANLWQPEFEGIDCTAMGSEEAQSGASQWQQDWFVYHNFIRGTPLDTMDPNRQPSDRSGVFVDVGGFHPIHLSNSLFFERCLGWRGVVVEPNPAFSPHFLSFRPNSELVRNCVWSKPRSVQMAFAKDPIEAYIQEEDKSGAVLIEEGGKQSGGFSAQCRTLDDILTSSGLRKPEVIDFMSVDAEAAEVEIFRDFPFADYDLRVVNVEVQAENYYNLDLIFFKAGYAKVAVLGGDHVFAKLDHETQLPQSAAKWQEALAKDFYTHAAPQTQLAKSR